MQDSSWKFAFKDPHWGIFEETRKLETRKRFNTRGHVWFYVLMDIQEGEVLFHDGETLRDIGLRRFGLFMPSWSLSYGEFQAASYHSIGCWSDLPLPETPSAEELSRPFIFEPKDWRVPASREEAVSLLKASRIITYVDRCKKANVVTRKIKTILDLEYNKGVKITAIAKKLQLSNARISTSFQRDLGISPVDYRNLLRSLVSVYYIAQGKKVADVSRTVGFETQSRFHSSARRFLMTSPRKFRAD